MAVAAVRGRDRLKAVDAGSRVAGKSPVMAARVRVVANPVEVRQEVKELALRQES